MTKINKVIKRATNRYNFRPLIKINYNSFTKNTPKKIINKKDKINIKNNITINNIDKNNISTFEYIHWDTLNQYINPNKHPSNIRETLVSANNIKNYLLKDTILDWLHLYYFKLGFNKKKLINKKNYNNINHEKNQLSILFKMGHKFEDEVIKYLRNKFPNNVVKVIHNYSEININNVNITLNYMKQGIPIIEQALLYNNLNKTFGVADILIRSDWINKIVTIDPIKSTEKFIKAPNLNGNYHYLVIDIKWTTMLLCSDGYLIRNNDRMPAYKGQLTLYNAALGLLQGYTPNKAFILAKAWKYTKNKKKYAGYSCFDRLGHIDFSTFDNYYINSTFKAIQWIRNVRYNGYKWKCIPPSIPELYPNMNNKFDTPYHHIKKNIANEINELTQIWMVGIKHRIIGHNNNIYSWNDPKCSAEKLGINGKKMKPIINNIININRDNIHGKIIPKIIKNNLANWQTKSNTEFYVDFETINECFYNRNINLFDSKSISAVIFLIGVGYEENGHWVYRSFVMEKYNINEEKNIIQQFMDFIDNKINNNICTIIHWAHAEKTMLNNANKRHGNIWDKWIKKINWLDFCKVFQDEPILICGAKKFNLKEIAQLMYNYGYIQTSWEDCDISNGLNAMIEATNFYRYLDSNKQDNEYIEYIELFKNIILYNEIDCKVVWELVNYLRNYHCNNNNNGNSY